MGVGVELPRRLVAALRALAVEVEQRLSDGLAVVAPLRRDVRELVDAVCDRAPCPAPEGDVERVACVNALDVGSEDPVFPHAGVGDHQPARLGLLEERERRQVVADRLVHEALAQRG